MRKVILGVLLVAVLGSLIAAFIGWKIYGVNTVHTSDKIIYINSGSSFDDVLETLDTAFIISDKSSFEKVASLMKYNNVKSGRYSIPSEMSNKDLVSLLRSGVQEPIDLVISHGRTLGDIASAIGNQMEVDSAELQAAILNERFLDKVNLEESNVISMIVPNTYQMYWDAPAEKILDRLAKEYDVYWKKREAQLAQLSMTKLEVSTLASIVESESQHKPERPTIAGVYLNRLKSNIPLQADPTVVYAVGDFTIRRVLNKHLEVDSPYNTYKYNGLPPGPICMPSISSLDAVLNAENHDYLFFCAKPGYNAGHSFAKTNAQHERNARVYRRWLSNEGIRG